MPRNRQLSGQTFGRWTVISQAGHTPIHQPRWLCRCECGTKKVLDGAILCLGLSKSCGCLKPQSPSELVTALTGHRFGRLVVLGPAEAPPACRDINDPWVGCQCDCGKTIREPVRLLKEDSSSCGCSYQELEFQYLQHEDLSGKRFGRLEVLSRAKDSGRVKRIWVGMSGSMRLTGCAGVIAGLRLRKLWACFKLATRCVVSV